MISHLINEIDTFYGFICKKNICGVLLNLFQNKKYSKIILQTIINMIKIKRKPVAK